MTGAEIILLIAAALFVLLAGFFSGAETAIVSADRAQLHAAAVAGDPRASLAERLAARMEVVLGATLVGTNLAVVTSTSLASLVLARRVPPEWESAANTLIMTPLILIFGEILPKSIGRADALQATLRVARPLWLAQRALYPAVWAVSRTASALLRLIGADEPGGPPPLSREELVLLAELGQEQGALAPAERRMIERLLALNRRPASSIMAPLSRAAVVKADAPAEEVKRLAAQTGHSRFPVYEGRLDNVVGVAALPDVLFAEARGEASAATRVRDLMRRDVMFAPETMPLGMLMRELRDSRTPLVIVVDERGAVAGLLSREDVVEEIVGEIRDERDPAAEVVAEPGGRVFECDGETPVDELAEAVGLPIEKEGFETAAGWVIKIAERIPLPGERLRCGPLRIEVLDADARRVKRLRIEKLADASTSEE